MHLWDGDEYLFGIDGSILKHKCNAFQHSHSGGQWHNYKVHVCQATLMCKVYSNSKFIVTFTHASMYLCTKNIHSFCNVADFSRFLQGHHSMENIVSALESALDDP